MPWKGCWICSTCIFRRFPLHRAYSIPSLLLRACQTADSDYIYFAGFSASGCQKLLGLWALGHRGGKLNFLAVPGSLHPACSVERVFKKDRVSHYFKIVFVATLEEDLNIFNFPSMETLVLVCSREK